MISNVFYQCLASVYFEFVCCTIHDFREMSLVSFSLIRYLNFTRLPVVHHLFIDLRLFEIRLPKKMVLYNEM